MGVMTPGVIENDREYATVKWLRDKQQAYIDQGGSKLLGQKYGQEFREFVIEEAKDVVARFSAQLDEYERKGSHGQ